MAVVRNFTATRVRQLRQERGWSARELAEECDRAGAGSLTRSAIAKIESGTRKLQVEEVPVLARVLGVSPASLLEPPEGGAAPRDHSERREPRHGDDTTRRTSPALRGREAELEQVLRGLNHPAGPHFWLVVAPPKLGKTCLLEQLRAAAADGPARWVTSTLDLHGQPSEVREDAGALFGRLFGREPSEPVTGTTRLSIARDISRSGRPHLCLLDGAELLSAKTAGALRAELSDLYGLVRQAGQSDVRLAVVVASRRDEEWKGVTPGPRLTALPLSEFSTDVVQAAVQDLADRTGRTFSPDVVHDDAMLVHRLSEGLPALVTACLRWIETEEWLAIERLESPELFERIAGPHIQETLFAESSLMPRSAVGAARSPEALSALRNAFRILAPYRLFTQSHLRHHQADPGLRQALDQVRWSIEDLWNAISRTALLKRPLLEPWQELHPPIRRLLFRYYYKSTEQRVQAHETAREFVTVWAGKQSGKDHIIGLVERLWHEAALVSIGPTEARGEALIECATNLTRTLPPSPAYTAPELRAYAAELLRNDEEFQDRVSQVPALADRLITVIEESV